MPLKRRHVPPPACTISARASSSKGPGGLPRRATQRPSNAPPQPWALRTRQCAGASAHVQARTATGVCVYVCVCVFVCVRVTTGQISESAIHNVMATTQDC
eukprot:1159074-Pelagomonas_calceolata.AAC.4